VEGKTTGIPHKTKDIEKRRGKKLWCADHTSMEEKTGEKYIFYIYYIVNQFFI
jgi:hypothetical protein